jgi:hypothetical protein
VKRTMASLKSWILNSRSFLCSSVSWGFFGSRETLVITDQNVISADPRDATNFLSCLRSIGKVMTVDLTGGGWGGRKKDEELESEPPQEFCNLRVSTCVHK